MDRPDVVTSSYRENQWGNRRSHSCFPGEQPSWSAWSENADSTMRDTGCELGIPLGDLTVSQCYVEAVVEGDDMEYWYDRLMRFLLRRYVSRRETLKMTAVVRLTELNGTSLVPFCPRIRRHGQPSASREIVADTILSPTKFAYPHG